MKRGDGSLASFIFRLISKDITIAKEWFKEINGCLARLSFREYRDCKNFGRISKTYI